MTQLTADAIHNWDTPYIQRQYEHLPPEIKTAEHKAMIRHHRQGTSAQAEAEAINTLWTQVATLAEAKPVFKPYARRRSITCI